MAQITKPELPPKAGYVEDIDENGNHYYRKIETEQDKLIASLQADNLAAMEALAEVYELITGGTA